MVSWTVSLGCLPNYMPSLFLSTKLTIIRMIYFLKQISFKAFSCPSNRWNPKLLLLFFFWFSFPSHLSFFLYTYPSLPGCPKFFSFVSPFTGTLLSSFILNINSILSLTSGHDSSLKLFRNRFPIDHAHCFHSV